MQGWAGEGRTLQALHTFPKPWPSIISDTRSASLEGHTKVEFLAPGAPSTKSEPEINILVITGDSICILHIDHHCTPHGPLDIYIVTN